MCFESFGGCPQKTQRKVLNFNKQMKCNKKNNLMMRFEQMFIV